MKKFKLPLWGNYWVFPNGEVMNVKTLHFVLPLKCKSRSGKFYHYIRLYREGKKYNWSLSRLVASIYQYPVPTNKEVNHLNRNTLDNWYLNHEITTSSKNHKHWRKHNEQLSQTKSQCHKKEIA